MEILAKQYIDNQIEILKQNDIDDAEYDMWLMVEHYTGIKKIDLILNPDLKLESEQIDKLNEACDKRITHIPVQHIIGKQNFCGLDFQVNENVLIPRFDTEVLVQKALEHVKDGWKILDLCTGSGCIAISIDRLSKCDVSVLASDISADALSVASKNNEINQGNVRFVKSNLFANIDESFDMIVSNPPYIPTKDIDDLAIEVKDHDPMGALDGGADGLDFYRLITSQALEHLNDDGYIIFEIGYDQGEAVTSLLESDFEDIEVLKDLAGNDRVVIAKKGTKNV